MHLLCKELSPLRRGEKRGEKGNFEPDYCWFCLSPGSHMKRVSKVRITCLAAFSVVSFPPCGGMRSKGSKFSALCCLLFSVLSQVGGGGAALGRILPGSAQAAEGKVVAGVLLLLL